jgi:hypothetical protein
MLYALWAHRQLNCYIRLANSTAWNVMHSFVIICLYYIMSPLIALALTNGREGVLANKARDGLAGDGRWCIIWMLLLPACGVHWTTKVTCFRLFVEVLISVTLLTSMLCHCLYVRLLCNFVVKLIKQVQKWDTCAGFSSSVGGTQSFSVTLSTFNMGTICFK